jgi:hypothetical protein
MRNEPLCLSGTRDDVLIQIEAWADGRDGGCIFWLNGMAGTGKSTIARTIAREYHKEGRLGASFFFSRGNGDVSHAGMFFTSIAVQLAERLPSLRHSIYEAIRQHNIATKGPREQWSQLLFQPLSKLEEKSPLVVVIDALDECGGEEDDDVRGIIQLLAEAQNLTTTRLRVFVTSRPETPIRHGFHDIRGILHRNLVLDEVSQTIVNHDISTFFRKRFKEISDGYNYLPADWPGDDKLMALVQRADGLFIYAATVCRFIKDENHWPPQDLLDLFIPSDDPSGLRQDAPHKSPTPKLDDMYLQILKHAFRKVGERDWPQLAPQFKQVVGSIAILFELLSITALAKLLGREAIVNQILLHLPSVVRSPESQGLPIRLLHLSFRDFLLDEQRCCDQHFSVDEKTAHTELAQKCLELMRTCLRRDICALQAPGTLTSEVNRSIVEEHLPPEVQYACLYWVQHLKGSKTRLLDNGKEHEFLQKHFLPWLEALSLMQKTSEGVLAIASLESVVTVSELKLD